MTAPHPDGMSPLALVTLDAALEAGWMIERRYYGLYRLAFANDHASALVYQDGAVVVDAITHSGRPIRLPLRTPDGWRALVAGIE